MFREIVTPADGEALSHFGSGYARLGFRNSAFFRPSDFGLQITLPKVRAVSSLQSQRDCVLQPRVASRELPWASRRNPFGILENSQKLAPPSGHFGQVWEREVKPEGRKPKAERRPKPEPRSASGFGLRISAFGLLSAFGLRASGFKAAFGFRS